MNVPIRLVAFAVVLALAFGGAALAGAAIDPTDDDETAQAGHGEQSGGHEEPAMAGMGGEQGEQGHGGAAAGGLAVSQDGYTLQAARTFFRAGQPARFAFRIVDAQGRTVRGGYELESQRELHLIVVRRDTATYAHLHPTKDASGTWSTALTLPKAGVYRAYADFQIGGKRRTLATDLFVPGEFRPRPLPAAAPIARADGYQVSLAAKGVKGGGESALTFRVTRNGRPVDDLQPYLGAKGHLVALREGDLAYLHVHPDEAKLEANEIQFMAEFPTAGRYRLFLQFKADGKVRTVAYTLEVPR
jgi:hypothetical protein